MSVNYDFSFAEYRVTAVIMDLAHYKLFKPVKCDVPVDQPKRFMKIKFTNKAIDPINLSAILQSV